MSQINMVTFSVPLLIILIGFGLCASSVRADEHQNQNTTEGGCLKHLFGLDGNAFSLISLLSSNRLGKQIKNGMLENQNAMVEKMSGIEAKLEKQIENGMLENPNSFAEKMAGTELFHFPLPIYRWNSSDCQPKIVINESTNAIQLYLTRFPDSCSCRAGQIQMPSAVGCVGIIYSEYRILVDKATLSIGQSTKEMPLDDWLGFMSVSYGYTDYGAIEGKNAKGKQAIISDNVPSFGTGDVVGCGLNWATRQMFFTKNGQHITNLYVDVGTADFCPSVSLWDYGDAVEANFGPNFQYDLSKEF